MALQGTTGGIPRVITAGDGPPPLPPLPGNASALASVAASPPPGPGEAKKVRTVVIKPDQPSADPFAQSSPRVASNTAAFPTGTAPPMTRSVNARTAPAQPVAPMDSAGDAPLSLSPQSPPAETPPTHPKFASVSSRPPPAASTNASSPAAVAGGGFVVQLAAQKTEEDAQSTFRAMQAKFASQLSGRQPIIRRKDLAEKGIFYGVQVGPFASREDAVALCESLKSAGGACMIQKN
jgi:cell division septation protein DedD